MSTEEIAFEVGRRYQELESMTPLDRLKDTYREQIDRDFASWLLAVAIALRDGKTDKEKLTIHRAHYHPVLIEDALGSGPGIPVWDFIDGLLYSYVANNLKQKPKRVPLREKPGIELW